MNKFQNFINDLINEAEASFKVTVKNKSGSGSPSQKDFTDKAAAIKWARSQHNAAPGAVNVVIMSKTSTGSWIEVKWNKNA